jgi:hypothetical protein
MEVVRRKHEQSRDGATLERQSFFASSNTIRIEAIREKIKNLGKIAANGQIFE